MFFVVFVYGVQPIENITNVAREVNILRSEVCTAFFHLARKNTNIITDIDIDEQLYPTYFSYCFEINNDTRIKLRTHVQADGQILFTIFDLLKRKHVCTDQVQLSVDEGRLDTRLGKSIILDLVKNYVKYWDVFSK